MPFKKIERLFRLMPWLLALLLAGVFLILFYYEWQRQSQQWAETLEVGLEIQGLQVEVTRWHLTSKALQAAELIARNPLVVETIREGYQAQLAEASQNSPETTRLRARLLEQLEPYWTDLQSANARFLQIHFAPDAMAFLRVHRPERFGDRVAELRPMVMEVIRDKKHQSGLEVGRHGVGYRGVVPIFQGESPDTPVIAVIEVGFGLLSTRRQEEGTGKAVLLAPRLLDHTLWEKARSDLTLVHGRTNADWLLESYSNAVVEAWHKADLLPTVAQIHSYKILHWEGRDYLLKVFPVSDYLADAGAASQLSAGILSWRDITQESAAHHLSRREAVLQWFIALLLAEIVMLVVWRYMLAYIRRMVDEHRVQIELERDTSEEARQRLELVLLSSESGFWDWDLARNTAVFSPEWRTLCGLEGIYIANEVDEWFGRVHPNDKAQFVIDRLAHIKGETSIFENEHRLRTQSGSYKWILTRGKVVDRNAHGKALRMLGIYTDISQRKQNELTILRQQAALRSLNEIASLPAVEFEEQLRRALVLGARFLGMRTGVISRVQDKVYSVTVQVAPDGQIGDGEVYDLGETYSSITLADGDVVAINHMSESPYAQHPCFARWQQEAYLGVPLWVEGDVYGTLCFTSTAPRQKLYEGQDKDFMRLLARWMGSVVGHWQQNQRQEQLYERYRKLSEHLPGFLYQYQLNPDGSGFFPYVSAGITAVYGVTPRQVRANSEAIYRVIHPDDLERVSRSVVESAANLSVWQISYRVNHPQRGLIWVHGDAQPERLDDGATLWHGFISDITAAAKAEERLQEVNSLREAIFDAASLAIISVDTEGIIKTFNRGAEKMLGYSAAEIVGIERPMLFHLQEEIEQRAQALTLELGIEVKPGLDAFVAKTRQGDTDEHEWHYVHRDGSLIPVLLSVSCLYNAAGEISSYFGIARDISELKRTDRLKSEFISTVSHELRTPLTAISGALGLITGGALGELPANAVRMLNIAHKNSLRLNHLVNDLLDMEKLVAGKMHFDMQPHGLGSIVQQSLEANADYAAQHQVRFELHDGGCDPQVVVDARRLLQVLTNYLSNAAKFSPPGSLVSVSIHELDDCVRVTVTDKGIGIAEEFRARIFHKFSQADASDTREKGGTGLGLAISKEMIERMGGSVGFESVLNEGSSFYFDLPNLRYANPYTHSITENPRASILIVEDNHDVAELLGAMLNNAGYATDIAHTGALALRYISERNYQLVTIDLHLPDIHGADIIRHIRKNRAHQQLPVIVISAAINEGRLLIDGDPAFSKVDWLEKPLQELQLVDLIGQAIHRSKQIPVRILHVEDDAELRHLIAVAGNNDAIFDAAGSLAEAREKCANNQYQLVILDLGLPDGNGWDLVPELRKANPDTRIIVLSSSELTAEQKNQIENSLVKSHQSNFELLQVIEQLLKDPERN